MINVIWRFTCDFEKFSHERIKIINNFISSKIRNERFDEEEINKLTENELTKSKWRTGMETSRSHGSQLVCVSNSNS